MRPRLGLDMTPRARAQLSVRAMATLLTALTLAIGLAAGSVRFIAATVRLYDNVEKTGAWIARVDSTLRSMDARLTRIEARK